MEIVIVGSGNVAEAVALAFVEAGMPPVQVFARNRKAAKAIAAQCGCGYTGKPSELAAAGLYIIAVSDKAIGEVAAGLKFGNAVVAHTAGSVAMDALPEVIKNKAVFYPLQSFTKGRRVDFREIPILVEGSNPHALKVISEVAGEVSENVIKMASPQRARVHMAAVFASNFVNYMYTVGEEITAEAGVDFSILKPLIRETAAKAIEAPSPRMTQTGPALRNDFVTKSLHVEMLNDKPELKNIYTNLSNLIWETSKKI